MADSTFISLGTHFDDFIESKVDGVRYKNASEVVCEGLRLLEEEEEKLKVLKSSIQEGVNSGIIDNFNAYDHLASLKANKK